MVDEAIKEVQLTAEDGLGQEAVTLSGGQKRRLCLAIALIAGSRVVFLGACVWCFWCRYLFGGVFLACT